MPMEISSSGTGDLNALVMFVVDATKPFSSPATPQACDVARIIPQQTPAALRAARRCGFSFPRQV